LIPIIRRIRRSEYGTLRQFCKSKNTQDTPFEQHDLWLENALNELGKNYSRVVFGVFYKRSFGKSELVGCLFLKKSGFDQIVELKNLLIAKEGYLVSRFKYLPKDVIYEIKSQLIQKAFHYCAIREFAKVEMELLQEEMKPDIKLLLDLGFKISSIKEKYLPGKFVCLLEKSIGETYQADPFNIEKLARWLINQLLNVKINGVKYIFDRQLCASIIKISFERFPVSPALSRKGLSDSSKKYNISGEFLIIEDFEYSETEFNDDQIASHLRALYNKESHLKYLFFDNLNVPSALYENLDINLVDYDSLFELAGALNSSLRIPFKSDEIGGIVTVLEEEVIHEYSKQNCFTYYLISGVSEALEINEDLSILAIFCPQWKSENVGGIIGYSEIEKVKTVKFGDANDYFGECYKALDEGDLEFYQNSGNSDEKIKILKCNRIRILRNPIEIDDLDLETNDVSYYRTELIDNIASAVYLDSESVKKVSSIELVQEKDDKEKILKRLRDLNVSSTIVVKLEQELAAQYQIINDASAKKSSVYDNHDEDELEKIVDKSEAEIKSLISKHVSEIEAQNSNVEIELIKELFETIRVEIQKNILALENKIDTLLVNIESNHKELIFNIVNSYPEEAKIELNKLLKSIEELGSQQAEYIVKAVGDGIENNLPNYKSLSNELQSMELSTQSKLKLSVPIIPLILSYETEFGLNQDVSLPESWNNVLKKLRGIVL